MENSTLNLTLTAPQVLEILRDNLPPSSVPSSANAMVQRTFRGTGPPLHRADSSHPRSELLADYDEVIRWCRSQWPAEALRLLGSLTEALAEIATVLQKDECTCGEASDNGMLHGDNCSLRLVWRARRAIEQAGPSL